MTRRRPAALETLLFLALGLVAIYAPLVPFSHSAEGPAAPDLLYCLVAAWVLRRPFGAPLAAVLALGLLADVLLMRPLGLGALGLVLAAELLRTRRAQLTGGVFPVEWLAVAGVFAAMLAATALVLRLAFTDAPGLGPALGFAASTALAYPVIAAALHWGGGRQRHRRGSA